MRVGCGLIVLGVALAACESSSGMTGGTAASASCAPPRAQTVTTNAKASVYTTGGHVYGCATSTRRRYLLGASGRTIRGGRVGPVALAGVDVAYGVSRSGVDTGSAQVVVRRLTDGKVVHTAPATATVTEPESFQSISALVVKPDGAVAWIGESHSIVGHGGLVEVDRFDRRGEAKLDGGVGIADTSLRLHRSQLSWRHSGRERSGTLN
jgi:hypothetical protein